ncbi:MAG: ribonuclease E/G [Proteobacteria bacterium]|nr:ribonuclease E/G [Pseudomonadota bacterium]
MATRMLIDAAHPEETRVVIVKGTRLEEFDLESATKAQLKGNIYLAKVTRVEPALQAAFVDYGGNRHGFLSFNEIHPDYYQIPVADKRALIEAESREAEAREAETASREKAEGPGPDADGTPNGNDGADDAEDLDATSEDAAAPSGNDGADDDTADDDAEPVRENIEAVGGDELDEVRAERSTLLRSYRIQEVIKRRQIILIQVVKEERGNKGAALTTYISLAGRYCVLMPNTGRGGGISRKITNATDRRRLKSIVTGLDIPEGMALIVRTAGSERSKAEIRRDYDFLYKLWSDVRETTLESRAPALVHEEASLIKRSIRDLYNKDIEEILIDGEEGYKTAKAFMRLLMPSHSKRVQRFRDEVTLFHKYRIDEQLDSMMHPEVRLKSGGYIVIGPTEALVAIDVNSGRATRERNIEATALKTNLEAADEIARQLRLRDLAGLIVIDFIDMEYPRNNRAVERKLKECLKSDRARIQVGRISHFGLLEMSRQRLRPSLLEASTEECRTCLGTGLVRSIESAALHTIRTMEEEAIRGKSAAFQISVASPVAIYLLNQKRDAIASIEARHGTRIMIAADDSLVSPETRFEQIEPAAARKEKARPAPAPEVEHEEDPAEEATGKEAPSKDTAGEEDQEDRPRRKRRRGKRGGRRRARKDQTTEAPRAEGADNADGGEPVQGTEQAKETGPMEEPDAPSDAPDTEIAAAAGEGASEEAEQAAARRPRRRRSRRRKPASARADAGANADAGAKADAGANADAGTNTDTDALAPAGSQESGTEAAPEAEAAPASPPEEDKPARPASQRRPRRPRAAKSGQTDEPASETTTEPAAAPAAPSPGLGAPTKVVVEAAPARSGPAEAATVVEEKGPPKRGWWRRSG